MRGTIPYFISYMPHTIFNRGETKEQRRNLRQNATPQETLLWSRLRNNQLGKKFRRQHGIGHYIADFYCHEHQLVIELDGSQHFDDAAVKYDAERTRFFEKEGCAVLRFSNSDVNTNLEGVLLLIAERLGNPSPQPSPQRREGV